MCLLVSHRFVCVCVFVSALDPDQESVEALMQRFKESFRTNTTMEITHFQNVTHSSSTGRKRGPAHTRGLQCTEPVTHSYIICRRVAHDQECPVNLCPIFPSNEPLMPIIHDLIILLSQFFLFSELAEYV